MLFRRVLTTALIVALAGLAAYSYIRSAFDAQTGNRVQLKLNEVLQPANLAVTLSDSKFFEGKGIRLDDVRIAEQKTGTTLIDAYRIFVHLPVSMPKLVTCEASPTGITVSRARLQLVLLPDGRLNLLSLLESLPVPEGGSQRLIPIRFTDSTVRVQDQQSGRQIELQNIGLLVQPKNQDGSLIQIQMTFNGDLVRKFEAMAIIDRTKQTWQLQVKDAELALASELITWLPTEQRAQLAPTDVHGGVRLSGQAWGSLANPFSLPKFSFSGSLHKLSMASQRLPWPVRELTGIWKVNQEGFQIENARGIAGQGNFDISYRQNGLFKRNGWKLKGTLNEFVFNQKLLDPFPEYCKKFCREFSPGGQFNVNFDMDSEGHREIRGELTNMSFSYFKFPYQLNHCVGTVNWVGDMCRFNVQALEGERVIKFNGHVRKPGPEATYECNLETIGDLPLDRKLLLAADAYPKAAKAVRAFRPTGRVSAVGKITKRSPRDKFADKRFDVRLHQCSVRHEKFDYPMHNVNGLVRIHNKDFVFEDVSGTNNSVFARCNGVWNQQDGLQVRFNCQNIPLDEQLRTALTPKIREIWDGFRPSGTVALGRVDLNLPVGQKDVDVIVNANLESQPKHSGSTVSIQPTWFPYRLDELTGQIEIGQGIVRVDNMRGKHGRAWTSFHGMGTYDKTNWSVGLSDLLAISVPVDDDLIRALPDGLSQSVRSLDYQGLINVNGTLTLSGQHSQPKSPIGLIAYVDQPPPDESSVRMNWDLSFDLDQAQMTMGIPLKNIFGNFRLIGQHQNNQTLCRGNLQIDSLTYLGIQITNLQGPIWLDNSRAMAGAYAHDSELAQYPQSLTGSVFGGQVRFDGQFHFGSDHPFYLQTTLVNSKLSEIAADVAPQFRDIRGNGFATLRLAGKGNDTNSIRGDGSLQLRDAKIYQLPVVVSLLKILNIKELNRTAFDTSNIDFSVAGDRILFDRMELIGDAISLIGNGQMNMRRDIGLDFYTVMGRNRFYIPLVSEILHSGAQQILWINVDGTLDNPRTHRKVLPQLNDSLRQLFQGSHWNPKKSSPTQPEHRHPSDIVDQRHAFPVAPVQLQPMNLDQSPTQGPIDHG